MPAADEVAPWTGETAPSVGETAPWLVVASVPVESGERPAPLGAPCCTFGGANGAFGVTRWGWAAALARAAALPAVLAVAPATSLTST